MSKGIYIVSPAQMHDIILRPAQNKPERYLCLDCTQDAKGITLIAIDNTSYKAWTEEFSSVPEAEAWMLAEPWAVKKGKRRPLNEPRSRRKNPHAPLKGSTGGLTMGSNENCNDSSATCAFNYQRVYICSPYRGDPKKNAELARAFCRIIVKRFPHSIPIAPHIYLTQFMDDDSPEERETGLAMGRAILASCQAVLVFGVHISEGMKAELQEAARLGIPVYDGIVATFGEIADMDADFWEKLVGIPKPAPVECPARRLIDPADFERYMLFEYPHTPGNQDTDIDDDSLRAILDAAHEYARARGIATDGKK